MSKLRAFGRWFATPLALVMFLSVAPLPVAKAAMISTDDVIGIVNSEVDRARVASIFAREDVRAQMEALGVDPNMAATRVAGLSDSEVQQIVDQLDELPAGQDAADAIVGAVFAILVILLITDILCLTKVYPFTKCVTAR
ncbi:MAG: PA2779 family protein [Gammaproteobacteria bacterium]|nr:PA2779 family protein [Gammaproteobacteria bacterium]